MFLSKFEVVICGKTYTVTCGNGAEAKILAQAKAIRDGIEWREVESVEWVG